MSKFKKGDKVKCLPGFNKDSDWVDVYSGGSAWVEGVVYTITSISENSIYNEVLWVKEIENKGVFSQSVTLYVEEPNYEIY